ncbi:hypothetical protein BFP72_12455 [Reichenbachiella sp. 5M10]|uniref:glycosyltransferase n=1 Tax=Reichenbachiella sp. 5M10 TaxID=1889772 RepID=UPI000C14A87C|nr:glycosyltransferase [Reichenbachiella sp. 5M10]PIB36147.1 hypothetical protein BFP72_12455 [Reichenbachiella sp. 5M10]
MIFLYIGCGLIVGVGVMVLLLVSLSGLEEEKAAEEVGELPFVSVLVSMRNESANVARLCRALLSLDYPVTKLEILIGDDDSVDDTLALLQEYASGQLRVIHFDGHSTGLYGKHRVLKQLLQQSIGELVLFTDADMLVHPGWVRSMLIPRQSIPVLKVGMTLVDGKTRWSQWQNIDWVLNQFLLHELAQRGVYVTAWGNNMAIRREDLDRVCYMDMEESVVEDVALLQGVMRAGGRLEISVAAGSILQTQAEPTWSRLLAQRVRWASGIRGVAVWVKVLLGLKLLFVPAVLVLLIWSPWMFLLFGVRPLLSALLLSRFRRESGRTFSWGWICLYEWYELALYFSSFVAYLLPVRYRWKGREY